MNIIIFAGNSIRNKEWADQAEAAFKGVDGVEKIYKHYYKHWETGDTKMDFDVELERFRQVFDTKNEPHMVCAKSVGSLVTMYAAEKGIISPDKAIFCGMPGVFIKENNVPCDVSKFLVPTTVFQNDGDTVTTYKDLVEILEPYKNFTIIETPGNHHDYEDFELITKTAEIQKPSTTLLGTLGIIGTGHFMNFMINNWFDYLVYIPVIAFFGPFYGLAIMIVLSIVVNLSLIKAYDWSGKDWLGFELLKEGKENMVSSDLPKWLIRAINSGDVIAFIGLSIYDPFLATVYLRKKEQAHRGLSARDWKIFFGATILSNVGWTGLVYGGISIFRWIFDILQLYVF